MTPSRPHRLIITTMTLSSHHHHITAITTTSPSHPQQPHRHTAATISASQHHHHRDLTIAPPQPHHDAIITVSSSHHHHHHQPHHRKTRSTSLSHQLPYLFYEFTYSSLIIGTEIDAAGASTCVLVLAPEQASSSTSAPRSFDTWSRMNVCSIRTVLL